MNKSIEERNPAVARPSTDMSPRMYAPSVPVYYPPHNATNMMHSWIPSPHYPSVSAPPPHEYFHLPAHPGASFDSSVSPSNGAYLHASTTSHEYTPTLEYGSMKMRGGYTSQRGSPLTIPSHNGFVASSQHPVGYGGYQHHSSHFFPPFQPAPNTSMWSIPTPPQPQPILLISDITPNDVLCGRGGATNSHSGNRVFRSFVKKFQERYLKAKKRDKPAVASVIVDLVRKQGGRFLRRYERTAPNGQVLWVDIGDERAREKVCVSQTPYSMLSSVLII